MNTDLFINEFLMGLTAQEYVDLMLARSRTIRKYYPTPTPLP